MVMEAIIYLLGCATSVARGQKNKISFAVLAIILGIVELFLLGHKFPLMMIFFYFFGIVCGWLTRKLIDINKMEE